jgi:hypothetical protein
MITALDHYFPRSRSEFCVWIPRFRVPAFPPIAALEGHRRARPVEAA